MDVVTDVVITPDGERAVSSSKDGTIKIWHLAKEVIDSTFRFDAPVHACTMVCDGAGIIAGDASGRVHFSALKQPIDCIVRKTEGGEFVNLRT